VIDRMTHDAVIRASGPCVRHLLFRKNEQGALFPANQRVKKWLRLFLARSRSVATPRQKPRRLSAL
jgi:hypothetical protein